MNTDISRLGTILGIWAHPDDETMGSGGIMALATDNGQKVACVTATKGEAGVQDESRWPAATLAAVREQEMTTGLGILGVSEHHWLDYPDGGCADIDEAEAVDRLQQLIEQYKPDTIITFPPDGITGHPDHQAVSRWALAASKRISPSPDVYYTVITDEAHDSHVRELDTLFNIFFAIDEPVLVPAAACDINLTLPEAIVQRKLQVMAAMPSQYAGWMDDSLSSILSNMLAQETLIHSSKATQYWPR